MVTVAMPATKVTVCDVPAIALHPVLQPVVALKPPVGAVAIVMVDDWTEDLPTSAEATALTYHYNAPNSEPPNAVLVAVSPPTPGPGDQDSS